ANGASAPCSVALSYYFRVSSRGAQIRPVPEAEVVEPKDNSAPAAPSGRRVSDDCNLWLRPWGAARCAPALRAAVDPERVALSQRTECGIGAAALIAAAVLAWPRGGDAPAPDGASGSGGRGEAPHVPVDIAHGSGPADGAANGTGGERTPVAPGGGPAAVALVV